MMITRRDWICYTGYGLITTAITAHFSSTPVSAQNNQGVTIEWLGHSAFAFRNSQARILVNPFTPLGCTAGYKPPTPEVDIVMISSRLLDEGSAGGLPKNPQLMVEPGAYNLRNIDFQGIKTLHDREGGRRFGVNVAWRWNQGGLNILHLGGIASPIGIEEKILMGTPDIVLIPVGGGPKTYNAEEAIAAIKVLNPRLVFPTQYLTGAAETGQCDLQSVDKFLQLAQEANMGVRQLTENTTTVRRQDLPAEGTLVRVFDDSKLISR